MSTVMDRKAVVCRRECADTWGISPRGNPWNLGQFDSGPCLCRCSCGHQPVSCVKDRHCLYRHRARPTDSNTEVRVPYNGWMDCREAEREADERMTHRAGRQVMENALARVRLWRIAAQTLNLLVTSRGRLKMPQREKYPADNRMKFIPEMKDMIVRQLLKQAVPETATLAALVLWESGEQPRTPTDYGCFEVFDTLQKQIDQGS